MSKAPSWWGDSSPGLRCSRAVGVVMQVVGDSRGETEPEGTAESACGQIDRTLETDRVDPERRDDVGGPKHGRVLHGGDAVAGAKGRDVTFGCAVGGHIVGLGDLVEGNESAVAERASADVDGC